MPLVFIFFMELIKVSNGQQNEQEKTLSKQQLEREFAKFTKDRIGKGPSKTEVKLVEGAVICIQYGFLTRAEEIIISSGQSDKVTDYRRIYITKCTNDLEKIILATLKRRIKHFFPSWILEKNVACWTFLLEEKTDIDKKL